MPLDWNVPWRQRFRMFGVRKYEPSSRIRKVLAVIRSLIYARVTRLDSAYEVKRVCHPEEKIKIVQRERYDPYHNTPS